jgi:excisionase family DNA binding protein
MTSLRETNSVSAPPLLDVAALADRLGVTERFVRRLVAERRVPFVKLGKFIRFDPRDIESWLEDARVPEL